MTRTIYYETKKQNLLNKMKVTKKGDCFQIVFFVADDNQ